MNIPLDVVPVPAVVVDARAVILDANQPAEDLLGTRDTLIGRPVHDVLPGFGGEHGGAGTRDVPPDDTDDSGFGGEHGETDASNEWVIDGRTYLVIEDADVVADGRALLLVEVSRLTDAREMARALARSRSKFLGKLSHEIRSAVASMTGFAEVLEDEVSDSNRELTRIITLSGRHLIDTLNAVMDLAGVEFGEKDVKLTEVDVIGRTRDRVMILRPVAERKGLELIFDPADEAMYARLNPIYLDRILHNLIDNAIKYTDDGRVEVDTERREGRVRLYVADTGRGMGAAFIPRLFAPFERERRDGDHNEGTGLGLAVTRSLVELMGGQIFASSTVGVGSTFTVSFPEATD